MSKKPKSPTIRDRIKDFRRVPASELLPNPKNWRTHPDSQASALSGVLKEIGIATAVVARELEDGSLEIIDGHLRRDQMPDQEIPVLILDVSEVEADKLLATMDPLAALAEADKDQLEKLLHSENVQFGDQAVAEMLANLAAEHDIIPEDDSPAAEDPANQTIAQQWEIVVSCRDEAEQKELYEALRKEGKECRLITL